MESWTFKFVRLLRSLWREILGGIIAIGVAAVLQEVYSKGALGILLIGIGLSAVLAIVLRVLAGRTHKVLVYVSSGSTCRDPMAKAITEQLLAGRRLKHPVDIYAVGLVPSGTQTSYGARQAIKEMYNADLLKDHKPTAITDELVAKADLILVMDKKLFDATKNTLPQNKTHILKDFFGLDGDVTDPWKSIGERDPKMLERYKKCADELKQILSTHMDTLLNALGTA
jgi:protein-tyrosine-phosphatase